MSTTPEQIDLWRSEKSEHQNLEFKEAKTQFDNKKLYKYCVAIANEGGGHLLLGIADQLPHPVVGSAPYNAQDVSEFTPPALAEGNMSIMATYYSSPSTYSACRLDFRNQNWHQIELSGNSG